MRLRGLFLKAITARSDSLSGTVNPIELSEDA